MMFGALDIVTLIQILFLIFCFAGILFHTVPFLEMSHWSVKSILGRLAVWPLRCCNPLMVSMLRICLWYIILRGYSLGDVAATGTCILSMFAVHGSSAASCRAFSMLVMLGLDEWSLSLQGKVLSCAVVAVAPLFPPRKDFHKFMEEVRDYVAQHGAMPRENPKDAGYLLARRIRMQLQRDTFNAQEKAQLHCVLNGASTLKLPDFNLSSATGQEAAGSRRRTFDEYMDEVRKYIAQHGCMPRENPKDAGYSLAKRMRMKLERGRFNAQEREELQERAVQCTRAAKRMRMKLQRGRFNAQGQVECTKAGTSASTLSLPDLNLSSATGREAGRSTTSNASLDKTVKLPAINIHWPFSQLILSGVKTIEARSYDLGYMNIAHANVEMWLVETAGKANAMSKGWVHTGEDRSTWVVGPRPKIAQIVGTVTFSHSKKYEALDAFIADRENHRIAKDGDYDWNGIGEKYAWHVSHVRRLAHPVPQPGKKATPDSRSRVLIE